MKLAPKFYQVYGVYVCGGCKRTIDTSQDAENLHCDCEWVVDGDRKEIIASGVVIPFEDLAYEKLNRAN